MDLLASSGGQADPTLSARRRKIALLVLLASARRPVSKDSLLEMFWGEQDETRARHSLSDALSHIRRVLGRGSVVANQSTAALDASIALTVDSVEFAGAVKEGNDMLALDLYAGPFLDGVHVDGSTSFEQWVSAERHRLSSLFGRACSRRASALLTAGEWDECAEVTRRWLECEPASSAAAKIRLQAIAGPGTRESAVRAVQEFERISQRLNSELGLRPDASVADVAREFANRIRQDELPAGHTSEFVLPADAVRARAASDAPDKGIPTAQSMTPGGTPFVGPDRRAANRFADVPVVYKAEAIAKAFTDKSPAIVETPPRKKSRWMIPVAVAALLIATIGAAFYIRRDAVTAVATARTAVALTDFEFVNGDSTQTWMADGLRTMLASRLSRSAAMELISPERVREIARQAKYPSNELLGTERARDVGAQAGADWIVSGAISKADTSFLLELTVRDVKSGKVLRVASVNASNTLQLTDAAAAKLLDVIDPAGSGAHLSELETSSQEAYQHFVAYVRYANGISNTQARVELDKALALDSGFISAIIARRGAAVTERDSVVARRLDALFKKYESRATFWDRTTLEAERIIPLGEMGKALALYRELVARYPRDPRAYTRLWNTLTLNGEWKEAEQVALRQLAIDSLAATAGTGVCAPCGAYSDLANTRLALGDGPGAERAARRLLELQPDLGGGWAILSTVLIANEKYDEGLEAYRRARAINPEEELWWKQLQARNLVLANRMSDADTLIAVLERSKDPGTRDNGLDIRALWYREQGKWAEALKYINQEDAEGGDKRQITLMRANTLARMGNYAGAQREFEKMHELFKNDPRGDNARWFSWSHTLLGDALAPTGDTTLLKVLADSAMLIGSNSYYARDKMAPHYLRALIAVRGGRDDEAEREFKSAMFSRNGFTRVNVEYAKLLIRKKRFSEADKLLHDALMGPLDAMLRYQPRSEVRAMIDSVRALSAKR